MLEIKMSEIIKVTPIIQKLKNLDGLSISTAYEIRKFIKVVTEKTQTFEEARIATVKSLGTERIGDEEKLVQDKIPEFVAQMEELAQKTEKLDISKIPFGSIKDSKGLTPGDLELLDAFIEY